MAGAEQPRLRKRRPEDQRTWERVAETLSCELALACLYPPPSGALVVPLKASTWVASSRYAKHGFGRRTLDHVLEAADRLLCDMAKGRRTGSATTITPTEALKREVASRGLSFSDFGRRSGEELIVLSRKRREEGHDDANAPPRVYKELVEYNDTPTTRTFRAEVASVNEFLERAPVAFLEDGLGPVNTSQRSLTRRFSMLAGQQEPRFDQGGRLFGAFWLTLARERRRSSLYVGGESAAEVDFVSLYPRLACTRAGKPIKGDTALYEMPGLENYRRGVKLATNALLFAPGIGHFPPTIAKELPRGCTVTLMREAILRRVPALAEYITPDPERLPIGHALMFLELQILMRALRECIKMELWALPLHDAALGPAGRARELKRVLEEASEDVVGVALPVSVKGKGTEERA